MALLVLLTLAASLPSLLTFATLFQVKEWRIDRLREHLRSEGVLRQLFGVSRPALFGAFLILGILEGMLLEPALLSGEEWAVEVLFAYILLGIVQAALGKQPLPKWTKKAIAVVAGSLVITSLSAILLSAEASAEADALALLLPLIPILQPFFLLTSSISLLPLDRFLKQRILRRACALRRKFGALTVIGITGSAGKTTTKELLAHIVCDLKPLVTPQHVNTELGVAQWLTQKLEGRSSSPSIAIVEMGAYRKGEITTLCNIVRPTIGIVTSIGEQHVALFGSTDAIIEAKGELLDALPESGHAFLNAENGTIRKLRSRCACFVTTVGTNGSSADLRATSVEDTGMGLKFRIQGQRFTVPLRGTHNIANVLLAIACAEFLNIGRSRIRELLQTFKPLSRTFELREEEGVTILDDTHNASPASFKAALSWAKSIGKEKEITLLTSGLMELGKMEDAIHRNLGRRARGIIDRSIFLRRGRALAFQEGFGRRIELFGNDTEVITKGSLLLCIGRMPRAAIASLLPKESDVKKRDLVTSLFKNVTGKMLRETLRQTLRRPAPAPKQRVLVHKK